MKYFPPERTQEQLDIAGVYRVYSKWSALDCLRGLANGLRDMALDSKASRVRDKLLAFEATLIKMHDELGEGL